MRLIDADALLEHKMYAEIAAVSGDFVPGFAIDMCPTIDAVQVVRCENCQHSCPVTYSKTYRWCYLGRKVVCGEDYCSDGEVKR